MSYILDALKKAERQRSLGQVPTLETSYADGTARRRRAWPWTWAAVIAVNGILLVLILRHPASPPSASQPAAARQPVTASHAAGPVVRPAAHPAGLAPPAASQAEPAQARAESHAAVPKSTAQPINRPPTAASHSAAPARLAQRHAAVPAVRAAASAPAATPVPATVPPAPSKPAPSGPTPAAPAAAPPPAPAQASAGATPATGADAASAEASAASPITAPIPLLRDLPFDFQKTVPPVRIDAMVYSDDEQSRMAFLNGHKYREGQKLEGSDLRVETILRQGVVLSLGGQRFLLTP